MQGVLERPTIARRASVVNGAIRLLGGLPLSFALMTALGVLLALRALVAQKALDLRDAGSLVRWLTDLAPERAAALLWPTVIALGLFVVNLALSSVEMARKALAKQRLLGAPRPEERLPAGPDRTVVEGPADAADRMERFLHQQGWRVRREDVCGEARLSAVRRTLGHWATLAFHAAFFVIAAGALVSVLTRFSGYFELAPGESFVERRSEYLRASEQPLLFGGDRGFRMVLDRMDLAFWPEGTIRDRASWVRILGPSGTAQRTERLAVNSPLSYEGMGIYPASREGFIAAVTVTDSAGTTAKGTLHFPFPQRSGETMRALAVLPGTRLSLELELYTGMLAEITGQPSSHAGSVSLLKVYERNGPHRRFLGVAFGGAELQFEGITLSFDGLKPFMSFLVVSDRGVPVVFAGLVLAVLALAALYFWVPQTCWAVIAPGGRGARVVLAGTAERYASSFRAEFRELAGALGGELSRR